MGRRLVEMAKGACILSAALVIFFLGSAVSRAGALIDGYQREQASKVADALVEPERAGDTRSATTSSGAAAQTAYAAAALVALAGIGRTARACTSRRSPGPHIVRTTTGPNRRVALGAAARAA